MLKPKALQAKNASIDFMFTLVCAKILSPSKTIPLHIVWHNLMTAETLTDWLYLSI